MKLLILVLSLLFAALPIATLSHDYQKAFEDNPRFEITEVPKFSDLGWLWVNYSPASYDAVQDSVSRDTWLRFIDPILKTDAVLVSLVPALVFYTLILLLKTFGIFPYNGTGWLVRGREGGFRRSKSSLYSFDSDKPKPMKYTRK